MTDPLAGHRARIDAIDEQILDLLRQRNDLAAEVIATKIEAFRGRGGDDHQLSHDLEDLVAVVDGRPELIAEIAFMGLPQPSHREGSSSHVLAMRRAQFLRRSATNSLSSSSSMTVTSSEDGAPSIDAIQPKRLRRVVESAPYILNSDSYRSAMCGTTSARNSSALQS